MSVRSNIVYKYDGTFDGLMCCVFECFTAKEMPVNIEHYDAEQETLFGVKIIETDTKKADRVRTSIPEKMTGEAEYMVNTEFLSCSPQKEMRILKFLLLGYKVGNKLCKLTTNEIVHEMQADILSIGNEAHFNKEFMRFSQYGEFLGARISPKNNVLPLVIGYFCDRLPSENFVIYDYIHRAAFVHPKDSEGEFMYEVDIEFPLADEEELYYRKLWRHFYNTIAVKPRASERRRLTMMRKHFWNNMTEFRLENSKGIDEYIGETIGEKPKRDLIGRAEKKLRRLLGEEYQKKLTAGGE